MTTYCVVCRVPLSRLPHATRTINFYVNAASAEQALSLASAESASSQVLGIEPFGKMRPFEPSASQKAA